MKYCKNRREAFEARDYLAAYHDGFSLFHEGAQVDTCDSLAASPEEASAMRDGWFAAAE